MSLLFLEQEFDGDFDFISELLFTVRNESKQYLERINHLRSYGDKISTNELRRIAHLMKSTANTIGLFEVGNQLEKIESQFESELMSVSHINSNVDDLSTLVQEIHTVANKLLMEIDA